MPRPFKASDKGEGVHQQAAKVNAFEEFLLHMGGVAVRTANGLLGRLMVGGFVHPFADVMGLLPPARGSVKSIRN
jgi:hypothetical protein